MMGEIYVNAVVACQEIESVMARCGNSFFDQSLNNEADIKRFSQKFSQFGRVLVAYDGETPAGFVAYYINSETKVSYISMIIIQKAYQGQGVGSTLLNRMKTDCKNADQQKIRLEVACQNKNAIGFYQKHGFVREGQASETSDYYSLEL